MREFLKHGAIVAVGLLSANALTYVYYALTARAVGVDGAGLFTSLISAMLILALPASIAASALARLSAEAVGRGFGGDLRRFGGFAAASLFPVAALAAVAAMRFAPGLDGFFHIHDPVVLWLAAAGFALTFPLQPQRAVLQGGGDFRAFALSNGIEAGVKAAAGALVIAEHLSLRAAVGGYVAAVLAAYVYNSRWTATRRGPVDQRRVTWADLREVLLGVALPIGAITALTFMDVVIVRHVFSATAAGLYGAAALAGRALMTVLAFVMVVLLPKATDARVRGYDAAPLLRAAIVAAGAVCGTALLATAFASQQIVTLLTGHSFAGAAPLLFRYCIAMSALGVASVFTTYSIGLGRRGVAVPLALCAAAEITALAVHHPDLNTVLATVIIGHTATALCSAIDVALSLRNRMTAPQHP